MESEVRFGVHVGPQWCSMRELRNVWRRVEDLGFDWVSTWDHLYAAVYPTVGGPCFEAMTTHAALATLTTRPRVGCLVYSAPFRHPAIMASGGATIDHLSEGRLEMGIGAGWMGDEHLAYGYPFDPPPVRLRRLAEMVEIVRALWTEDFVDYDGEFYTLRRAVCEPKPLQSPPRIWIGATGEKRGLEVAGRLGDGWNVVLASPEDFARKLAIVKAAAPRPDRLAVGVNVGLVGGTNEAEITAAIKRRFGLAVEHLRPAVLAGSSEQMADHVARYVAAGARWIVLALRAPFELDVLERFTNEVMPRFRATSEPRAVGTVSRGGRG